MFDEFDYTDEAQQEGFSIRDDSTADWALVKIKEEYAERDRLLELVKAKQEELKAKSEQIIMDSERKTSFLRYKLAEYFGTVKTKETKTQKTYKLLSGSLVYKKPAVTYERSEEALATWLEGNGYEELVQTVKKPKWAELKPLVCASGDKCVMALTGEVIEGIKCGESEGTFDVK